jgi:hypothetical protein
MILHAALQDKLRNVLSEVASIATQDVGFSAASRPKVAVKNKGRMNAIYAAQEAKSDIDCF